MRVKLKIWRQDGPTPEGRFETHVVMDATPKMSLLELLDRLNDQLAEQGLEPISFESDCREGVCGACGATVNDVPHGLAPNILSCRQHLRAFGGIVKLRIGPLRSATFPVVRDLMVNRAALDFIIRTDGHVDIMARTAPDTDDFLVGHEDAELAPDFAACTGCGACVATYPNEVAHLFAGAKLAHLAMFLYGKVECTRRARIVVDALNVSFGPCSSYGKCVEVCLADLSLAAVAAVHREGIRSFFKRRAQVLPRKWP